MTLEQKVHVRWDGRLYPEVETADVRKFLVTFGTVVDLVRKSNLKKGPVPFCSVTFSTVDAASAALALDAPSLEEGTPLTISREKDAKEVRATAQKRQWVEDVEREIKRKAEEKKRKLATLVAMAPEYAKFVYVTWESEDDQKIETKDIRKFFAKFGTIVGIVRPEIIIETYIPPYCSIEYLSVVDAKMALMELHQQHLTEKSTTIGATPIQVGAKQPTPCLKLKKKAEEFVRKKAEESKRKKEEDSKRKEAEEDWQRKKSAFERRQEAEHFAMLEQRILIKEAVLYPRLSLANDGLLPSPYFPHGGPLRGDDPYQRFPPFSRSLSPPPRGAPARPPPLGHKPPPAPPPLGLLPAPRHHRHTGVYSTPSSSRESELVRRYERIFPPPGPLPPPSGPPPSGPPSFLRGGGGKREKLSFWVKPSLANPFY